MGRLRNFKREKQMSTDKKPTYGQCYIVDLQIIGPQIVLREQRIFISQHSSVFTEKQQN